jgi:pimeloyl-ACP methyl ester carboxylesterase
MASTKTSTLRVPGARLYYEVRGSGPVLLLIHGGGGNTQVFYGITHLLADQFTIVTYDRRGLGHSQLDDPQEEQQVEVHSDDAHRLLAELTTEPAYVFGSSGGAIVGLDLAARYPEQIRTLIAHEPPTHLLPEADPIQEMAVIREIYYQEGIVAALQKLAASMILTSGGHESEVDLSMQADQENLESEAKNLGFLFEQEFPMYDRYHLDIATLKNVSDKILLAGGRASLEDSAHKSAEAVAEQIGTSLVEFPGGHVGYVTHPKAFAQKLREALA